MGFKDKLKQMGEKMKEAAANANMNAGGMGANNASGQTFGAPAHGGSMNSTCTRCGRELGSIHEKNSGICDSCRNNPGGPVGHQMFHNTCSKCHGSLISVSEQQSGICDQCKISGRSNFGF